jgi:hypothetical protein
MSKRGEELWFIVSKTDIGEESESEEDVETKMEGTFEYYGPISYVTHQESPMGSIPIGMTTTVAFVRGKTTGKVFMCDPTQITFKNGNPV